MMNKENIMNLMSKYHTPQERKVIKSQSVNKFTAKEKSSIHKSAQHTSTKSVMNREWDSPMPELDVELSNERQNLIEQLDQESAFDWVDFLKKEMEYLGKLQKNINIKKIFQQTSDRAIEKVGYKKTEDKEELGKIMLIWRFHLTCFGLNERKKIFKLMKIKEIGKYTYHYYLYYSEYLKEIKREDKAKKVLEGGLKMMKIKEDYQKIKDELIKYGHSTTKSSTVVPSRKPLSDKTVLRTNAPSSTNLPNTRKTNIQKTTKRTQQAPQQQNVQEDFDNILGDSLLPQGEPSFSENSDEFFELDLPPKVMLTTFSEKSQDTKPSRSPLDKTPSTKSIEELNTKISPITSFTPREKQKKNSSSPNKHLNNSSKPTSIPTTHQESLGMEDEDKKSPVLGRIHSSGSILESSKQSSPLNKIKNTSSLFVRNTSKHAKKSPIKPLNESRSNSDYSFQEFIHDKSLSMNESNANRSLTTSKKNSASIEEEDSINKSSEGKQNSPNNSEYAKQEISQDKSVSMNDSHSKLSAMKKSYQELSNSRSSSIQSTLSPIQETSYDSSSLSDSQDSQSKKKEEETSISNSFSVTELISNSKSVSEERYIKGAKNFGALDSLFNHSKIITIGDKQYITLKAIGKGGSSVVYKVLDCSLNVFALKKVNYSNEEERDSLLNEISILKTLRGNPYIVQMNDYSISSTDNSIFLTMECGECDFASLLKSYEKMDLMDLVNIRFYWKQMLCCVFEIFKNFIVHGDLKPQNFICCNGSLKLIDFGIAKAIESCKTTNIYREDKIGTLNYISPEALIEDSFGKIKQGRASDVWSLGCILYQMVYGYSPFSKFKNLPNKLRAIIDEKYIIPFPDKYDSESLYECMKRSLQRNPKNRATVEYLLNHPFLKN